VSAAPLRRASVLFRLTAVMDVWPARAYEGCTCIDENSAPCALCCDIALKRVRPSELALAKPSSGSSSDGSVQSSPAGVGDVSVYCPATRGQCDRPCRGAVCDRLAEASATTSRDASSSSTCDGSLAARVDRMLRYQRGEAVVAPPGEVLPAPPIRRVRPRLDYRLRMVVLPFGERNICPGAFVTVELRAAHAWMPKVLRAHHLVLREHFVVRSVRAGTQEFVRGDQPAALRTLTRVPDWGAVIGAVHPMQDVRVVVENAGDRVARFDALWYATAVRDEYRG
jgi:hypothetical protein